jgi:transcriptional regulator with XRE-family HTH domain
MSLSDRIKYLRAVSGGLTPWEIADKSGVPAREIHLIEVKHRRVGENDEVLEKLAGFFNVPLADLMRRREAYRKRLTLFIEESEEQSAPVVLKLEGGEEIEGTVAWFGREALGITVPGAEEPIVVQRGWVADWRRADNPAWEVSP